MRAEFTDNLITGNDMIDSQHKELIEKINQLLKSIETSKEKITAVKMLNYLSDYVDYHFAAEEKLQEEIQYPGIEEHKKQHVILKNTVDDLFHMLEEEEGPSPAFVEQLNNKVIEWLYTHIQGFGPLCSGIPLHYGQSQQTLIICDCFTPVWARSHTPSPYRHSFSLSKNPSRALFTLSFPSISLRDASRAVHSPHISIPITSSDRISICISFFS